MIAEAVAGVILPIARTKTALLASISAERPGCTNGRRVAMSRLPYRGKKSVSIATRWLVNRALTISNEHRVARGGELIVAFTSANIAGPAHIGKLPRNVSGVAEGEVWRPANVRKLIRPPARATAIISRRLQKIVSINDRKGFSRT